MADEVHSPFKINNSISHEVIFSKHMEKVSDIGNLCFHFTGGIKGMPSFL